MVELGEDDRVRLLGLRRRVGVDEEVLVVARDGDVPAGELLREVGAERAEAILEKLREPLPRVLVLELDPHSPVLGHGRSIVIGLC